MLRARDLKVGDVIQYWPTGERGMRVVAISPYTGRYPQWFDYDIDLVGLSDEANRTCKTSARADDQFRPVR